MKSLSAAYLSLLVLLGLVAAWAWESGLQPIPNLAATSLIVTPQDVVTQEIARQAEERARERGRRKANRDNADAALNRGPSPVQPKMTEPGKDGPLPRIGDDGRLPWKVYARKHSAPDHRPRLAVIVGGLGLSSERTEQAIGELPPEVSLAFSPYARDLQEIAEKARDAGHETLIGVPMEPADANRDPGPHALKVQYSAVENTVELKWALSRFAGYAGVISEMGALFTTSPKALRPVLRELAARGLMFVDIRTSANSVGPLLAKNMELPFAFATMRIDEDLDRAAVNRKLAEIETTARTEGVAVLFVTGEPIIIESITRWAPTLAGKGLTLAPVTAIASRQKIR